MSGGELVQFGAFPIPGAASIDARIDARKGTAEGIASLDEQGRVPDAELPARLAEAALSATIAAAVDEALEGFEPTGVMLSLFIGENLDTSRPAGHTGPIEWIITVVGGTPVNVQSGDKITEVSLVPVPITVWADTFSTDGPLGNTETGALPWVVLGTGYAAARASGHQVFTGGTSSVGVVYVGASAQVDADETVTFKTKIATKGASNQAGIVFNFESFANHLALVRTSSSSGVYRLVKRTSSTYATLATAGATWPTMADGDNIEIVIVKATGAATFKINGVVCWTGTLVDYLASIGNFGHYCGASTAFAEMAYDDSSMVTLVEG